MKDEPVVSKEMTVGDNGTTPTEWKNPPSLSLLKEDVSRAANAQAGHQARIHKWLDYRNATGSVAVCKVKGRSTFVPKLVRKHAEWRYTDLSEPFLSNQKIFQVNPVTYEDAHAAKQNELLLNSQIREGMVRFVDEVVRDFVDTGTVIVRTGWDYKEETFYEDTPLFTLEVSKNERAIELFQRLDGALESGQDLSTLPAETVAAYNMTKSTGIPHIARKTGTKRQKVTKVTANKPTATVVDFKNIIYDPSCNGDLRKASFVVNRFHANIAELKSTGLYKDLDKIQIASEVSTMTQEQYESRAHEDISGFSFVDDTRKKLTVYEYWGYFDIHGDGTLVSIVVVWVGDTFIRMEENPYPDRKIPFHSGSNLPVKNSVFGEPDAELLADSQDTLGATQRGIYDILGRSANAQVGMRKDALDFNNRKKFDKGLNYEYNGGATPSDIFFMHTFPEVPTSALNLLQYTNQESESLTGIKAFNGGISGDSLGATATGARGALDAASRRKLGILRRLGELFTSIGRSYISMNSKFLSDEEVVRVTNDTFIPVRRDDLSGQLDLIISVSTAEEDEAKAQELAFMMQTIGNNTDPAITNMILADIADLRKMPTLAEKLRNYEPKPDPIAQETAMLTLELLKAQIANESAKANENNANAEYDRAKAQTEVATAGLRQSERDRSDLDYLEQEAGITQQRSLENIQAQSQGNMDLKNLDHSNKLVQEDMKKMDTAPSPRPINNEPVEGIPATEGE